MGDNEPTARPDLWPWLMVAVLIGVGIALFFMYAPGTSPAVTPAAGEIVP